VSVEKIPITSKEQWLNLRKFDITASVVSAINGLHPYVSPLRLYYEKGGLLDFPKQDDSGVLRRGRILESAVGTAVSEQKPEWTIEKNNFYFRDTELGIGATPDFFIHGDPRGLGTLQAKTVAPSVYARDWIDGRPPTWIVVQNVTECMLTDAKFGAVAALVIDPYDLPCHVIEIPRHAAAEAKIREDVAKFWQDIEDGNEPGPDYGLDRELLAALSPKETPDITIDLSTDNEVMAGLAERADLKIKMKIADERCKQIETMIMARMRDAAIARVPDFRVTWKTEDRKGYTVEPKSNRVLRIYDKRE
jgi:predicted phage-related endonuclease